MCKMPRVKILKKSEWGQSGKTLRTDKYFDQNSKIQNSPAYNHELSEKESGRQHNLQNNNNYN